MKKITVKLRVGPGWTRPASLGDKWNIEDEIHYAFCTAALCDMFPAMGDTPTMIISDAPRKGALKVDVNWALFGDMLVIRVEGIHHGLVTRTGTQLKRDFPEKPPTLWVTCSTPRKRKSANADIRIT